MIHTIDTTNLSDGALEALAKFYDVKQAEAMNLSGAVPTLEAQRQMEDAAEAAGMLAAELRKAIVTRATKFPWVACFRAFNALPAGTRQMIKRAVSASLVASGASEVGSSDANHEIFARWKRNGRDFGRVLSELVDEGSATVG
jgi:hypothetical protein